MNYILIWHAYAMIVIITTGVISTLVSTDINYVDAQKNELNDESYPTYYNPLIGAMVKYPSNWIPTVMEEDRIDFTDSSSGQDYIRLVGKLEDPRSIDELIRIATDNYADATITIENSSLDGIPASKLNIISGEFSEEAEGKIKNITGIYAKKDNAAYILFLTQFHALDQVESSSLTPLFRDIIESFEFTGQQDVNFTQVPGFSMFYPKGWEERIIEFDDGSTSVSYNSPNEEAFLDVEISDTSLSFDRLMENRIKETETQRSSGSVMVLSDTPAYWVVTEDNFGRQLEIGTVKYDKLYQIYYSADNLQLFDKYRYTAGQMINSIILPPEEEVQPIDLP